MAAADVLKFKGAPEIVTMPILQKPDGSLTLPASEARLHGATLQSESGESLDDIGHWTNPDDWADWEFKVTKPGRFTVSAVIAAPASGSFDLSVAGRTLRCSTPVTGSYITFQPVTLGVMEIPTAGDVTLAVHPAKERWQPINLRAIEWTPAAANP